MVTFPLRRKLGAEDIAHGHNRSLSSFKGKLSGIGCKSRGARLMTFPQNLGRSSVKAMASILLVSLIMKEVLTFRRCYIMSCRL